MVSFAAAAEDASRATALMTRQQNRIGFALQYSFKALKLILWEILCI